jgi:hypothetical protein
MLLLPAQFGNFQGWPANGNQSASGRCGEFARDLILRGVATFLRSRGCTPTHPFVNASVFQTTAARSRRPRHGLCFTIVSRHPSCLNHDYARQQGRVHRSTQTNRVREGQRRFKALRTDANHESNQSLQGCRWSCFLNLSDWSPGGVAARLATPWVGRKPGLGAAGLRPRVPGWLRAFAATDHRRRGWPPIRLLVFDHVPDHRR